MIVVVIAALLMGASVRLWQRSKDLNVLVKHYRTNVNFWNEESLDHAIVAEKHEKLAATGDAELRRRHRLLAAREHEIAANHRRTALHHEQWLHKYERAARYPWMPIELEPPDPE